MLEIYYWFVIYLFSNPAWHVPSLKFFSRLVGRYNYEFTRFSSFYRPMKMKSDTGGWQNPTFTLKKDQNGLRQYSEKCTYGRCVPLVGCGILLFIL